MKSNVSRRNVLKGSGAALLAAAPAAGAGIPGPRMEGPDTPKICLEMGTGGVTAGAFTEAGIRRVRQLGVNYALTVGPPIPWREADLRARIDQLKAGGITLYNMMIGGYPNTLYGKPGRDEEIDKVRQSLRAAGKAG
ncbi:MAG: twin-arginine translocation signal domain-containing protein, partial [Bryobacterales bacterium]|nr:twin-arginine translocation signal domain-containing protein [Bryobacterales bacterium]